MDLRDKNNLAAFYGCDINKLYSSNYYKIIEGLSKNCDTKDIFHAAKTLATYHNHSGAIQAINKAINSEGGGNKGNLFIALIMMSTSIHELPVNNLSKDFFRLISDSHILYSEMNSKVIVIGKIGIKERDLMLKKATNLYEINFVYNLYKKSHQILSDEAFRSIESYQKIGHTGFYMQAVYSIVHELHLKK